MPLRKPRYKAKNSSSSLSALRPHSSPKTGSSYAANGLPFFTTIKYSNAGVPLWTNRYNGPGNSYGGCNAIALDSSGNVFVAGNLRSAISDALLGVASIKYSNTGVPLWTNRYNGGVFSEVRAMALDSSGHVFVTGLRAYRWQSRLCRR